MRKPILSAVLALVYLAMVGEWSGGDALTALAAGIAASSTASRARGRRDLLTARSLLKAPRFLAGVCGELARSTVLMLRVLAGKTSWRRLGFVDVPAGERTPRGVAVSGHVVSLTPGAVLVVIDEERRVMTIHAIDASDPEKVRSETERFYERSQRGMLP